ncbi:6-phospho-3-hexuloisomerase [Sporolactobacillus sp. CQH2019]|uniref:6-phospho-3-hexuloisomerase n=1 Tax=Sporolactobacillus sp. CQH2019 TaxID=3023512 RepID=UPI0023679AC8|nr:6-phospho-3-hexuloisomerase [Sporolactobacillus sp. CQH2019]MDD9148892.1 6-phospho-3-hexuloisomerase [Sporolactobacillus sp. CQH2019]
MTKSENLLKIINELHRNAALVDNDSLSAVERLITRANRVYLAGAGRSGFAARGFANRLMHLGYRSYFVGETITPAISDKDLLIIGSGSGETASLVADAKKAKEIGAWLATLTIYPDRTIGALADAIIEIPGVTSKVNAAGTDAGSSIQPHGSSFEQMSWLVYDAMVVDLMLMTHQTDKEMFARHANLE